MDSARYSDQVLQSVAIIGMAGRFPGADDLATFWRNVANGVESVETVSDEQLLALGVDADLLADPRYVKRTSRLSDVRGFDAELFDISPREAEITDPQHRLLLECAYEAIEHAGYNPFGLTAQVGVYAGVSMSDYLIANVAVQPDFLASIDGLQLLVGSDKSYACTRISHKLNLQGPSVAIDSACSTSLVAVHMAAKALLTHECDMALAGGAKVAVPHGTGYLYQPGSILSADGSCRPFDAAAGGTLHGSGVGIVLLKRLADALDDGDTIHAVIRGSAINNDGSRKIGYTAPGVQGQARVIAQALAVADVEPASIGYLESHGTGTSLGDPIEIAALSEAFLEAGPLAANCALGSLKGNIGHLDVAAGVAGLIKTTLVLQQAQLPPSVGFRRPNPEIAFAETPFFVNQSLKPWDGPLPRRAGVSSFGIGGTNAHVVLEQAPELPTPVAAVERPLHLVRLSARSATALDALRVRFVEFLADPDRQQADIADIAFTANTGRAEFAHRLTVTGRCRAEIAAALADPRSPSVRQGICMTPRGDRLAFLFTGQGAQYAGMGRALYTSYPPFRARLDALAELMARHLPLALTDVLWGAHCDQLNDTRYTQPALFALQLALAQTWSEDFGVRADVMMGHSVGEVSAACHAGVFSAADGMRLICARAAAMAEHSAPGAMCSLALSVADTRQHLRAAGVDLAIAAINGPHSTVVSGTPEAISALCVRLDIEKIGYLVLPMQRAFHSAMMEPALDAFRAELAGIEFQTPRCPLVSNVSGLPETTRLASADYWIEQARATVQFEKCMHSLQQMGVRVHLEIGPRATLVKLGRSCVQNEPESPTKALWLSSLESVDGDWQSLLDAIAVLHVNGVAIDWHGYDAAYPRRRATLPTYPFQRQPHWCLPDAIPQAGAGHNSGRGAGNTTIAQPAAQAAAARVAAGTSTGSGSDDFAGRVAAIWCDLLGLPAVADDDDFFALGGHSLLVVQLVARVERDFGIALPMNAVVQNPRLSEFVVTLAHLQECGSAPVELPTVVADPAHAYDRFPLVDLQQAFYLGRSNEFGLGGVSTHLYFELAPPHFDPERFVAAWNALIARHGMLRAIILDENEQRVLESVPHYPVERYDFADLPDALPAHLDRIRDEMSHQVRPADQWPLFDVRMTRESSSRWRIHFSIDLLMLDVRSNQILFRDLDMLYQGQHHELPALPIEFRDYVLARRNIVEGERQRAARAYWMERVPTMPLAPNLPLVGNPADLHKPGFARRIELIETQRWHRLRRRAQGIGVTPSALLMTVYGLVIARWSKRPDFTLNVTMFDRLPLHPCVNELVGDFTTLSLMSVDYSTEMPLKERARALQRQLWRDVEHSSFSGVQVLRELTRHHGGEQITMPVVFTSALPLDAEHGREVGDESLFNGIEDGYAISQTPQVWIDHVASEEDGRLILSWDAIDEMFPAGMLDDMFSAYVGIVTALADGDELWTASRIDLLPERQRAIRDAANATAAPYPEQSLAAAIHHQALLTPDAPAILSRARNLSYGELYGRASYWAAELQRLEVQPDELVAVLMEKGWQQVVAALAIQLAGAAYMPIDAHQPHDRRQQLVNLGQPRIALTQPDFEQSARGHDGLIVLCVSEDSAQVAAPQPPAIRSDRDLGCVLFTSGSTGVPKGVMIEHRAAANTMVDVNARFNVTARDRALAVSSLGFDLSIFDLFGMLAAGGALVVPAHDELKDPAALAALMREFGVTIINSVPAMLDMLVDHHEVAGQPLPTALRLVMMSGDFIPVSLPGRIWARSPQVQVESLGGPTETVTWCIAYPVRHVDPAWPSIPYGKPMLNRTCHVLDDRFEDRPEWVPGEIWVGSDGGNARGYWQDAERTAAGFVRHPRSAELMFRTGDVGRYLPDGNIEILGRSDFQVKVNGYRVELGEIEALIGRDPRVRRAIVAAKEVHAGSKQVVAYLQFAEDRNDEALLNELRTRCVAALPDYMVPAHFIVLDSFPLSPNGKIDRVALPLPTSTPGDGIALDRRQGPRDELEQKIAAVWCAVLELDTIGVFENFLELGGHSLVAARVATRLREALGVPIAIRTIFDHPNIAALADAVRSQKPAHVLPPVLPGTGNAVQLSYAQQRLWFIDRFERTTSGYAAAYNMPIVLALQGHIDDNAMQRALSAILARHHVLRTGIVEENGRPVAKLEADAVLPWRVLQVPANVEPASWTDAAVLAEFETPFDLARPPLMRGVLIHCGDDEHVLVIGMHHIVTDAWSAGLMLQELQALYAVELSSESTVPPPPDLQYADFAAWQRQVWDQGLMSAPETYWLHELSALPAPLVLASDRPRTAQQSYAGGALSFEIEPSLTAAVQQFALANGATPFMVHMAAFNLLLHRYTGASDILVGTDSANRFPGESERMLGFFINQLVIRTRIDPQADVRQLLASVRDKTLRAYEHEAMPFDRLLDRLQIARDPSTTPLFQVKLNMLSVDDATLALPGLSAAPRPHNFSTVQYDLVLTLKADGERFIGTLQYRSELFAAARMQAAIAHYLGLLRAMLDRPGAAIAQLDYLADSEQRALLERHRARAEHPQQLSIDQRVSLAARLRPDAIALSGSGTLSYAELEQRSNALAAWLTQRVAVGARVGLYLEVGINQVIAILAVLKAGAAYVPLDSYAPAERIEMILDDSQPVLILSDHITMAHNPLPQRHAIALLDTLDLSANASFVSRAAPQLPAYVIYTSGTTGRPNGVVVTHAHVGRLLDACQGHYRFAADDVWTLFHSYVFDFTVWELWGALCHGGRLVVVPYWVRRSPPDFWSLIIDEGVTVLSQTPSAFRPLMRVATAVDAPRATSLRWVVFGGEALELQSLRPWFERFGDVAPRLVNMYGITETTVHVTLRPLSVRDLDVRASLIGAPLDDLGLYLLDAAMRPVPAGVDGELYVSGAGVAPGYLARPALTAQRFVPDPYSTIAGARLYRTGDIARRTLDGDLEYVGRIDHQVKIRGHRIELGEIESHLARHPAVAETLLIGSQDQQGHSVVIAYVVAASQTAVDVASLRYWLQERVPEYMVPAAFILLPAFPLTINGKVDRKALPNPDLGDRGGRTFVAPSSVNQIRVASVLRDLLDLPRVGLHDNFFELGGHSLLATQLVSHLQEEFGVQIELRAIFEHATVLGLVGQVEAALQVKQMQRNSGSLSPTASEEEFLL